MTLSSILPIAVKFILRTISILIGLILAIFGYTILHRILRAIGWVISIATLILLLDWLL